MSHRLMHHVLDQACFGSLLRERAGTWHWHGGGPEPRVVSVATRRLEPRPHDDRAGDGSPLVQVPMALVRAYDALAWLRRGIDGGEFTVEIGSGEYRCIGSDASSRRLGGVAAGVVVALVPAWRWRSWCCVCALAPAWAPADEDALFERARRLGWTG